ARPHLLTGLDSVPRLRTQRDRLQLRRQVVLRTDGRTQCAARPARPRRRPEGRARLAGRHTTCAPRPQDAQGAGAQAMSALPRPLLTLLEARAGFEMAEMLACLPWLSQA